MSVLFIDLDRFSAYNHRHGDLSGDQTLRQVAQTLAHCGRERDRVFRKGGEEFAAVLPGTDQTAAAAAAERLRAAVEALGLEHGGAPGDPVVTVTIGVATQERNDPAQALNDAADAAFGSKVADRRNTIAIHTPEHA